MYIKEDLMYDKHTNALVGFANLSEVNNHSLTLEKSLQREPSNNLAPLTKTAMVMMIHGLCEFPYVQLQCDG